MKQRETESERDINRQRPSKTCRESESERESDRDKPRAREGEKQRTRYREKQRRRYREKQRAKDRGNHKIKQTKLESLQGCNCNGQGVGFACRGIFSIQQLKWQNTGYVMRNIIVTVLLF